MSPGHWGEVSKCYPMVIKLEDKQRLLALHTEPAPAVRAAVKTVLSCQSFALSSETGHFGCA